MHLGSHFLSWAGRISPFILSEPCRIFHFHPFWAIRRAFPLNCVSAGGQCFVSALELWPLQSPQPPSSLGGGEGRGSGLLVPSYGIWQEESKTSLFFWKLDLTLSAWRHKKCCSKGNSGSNSCDGKQRPASPVWKLVCWWVRMVDVASSFFKMLFNLWLFAVSFKPDCTGQAECVFKLCWEPAANKRDKGILFLAHRNNREGINKAQLKNKPSVEIALCNNSKSLFTSSVYSSFTRYTLYKLCKLSQAPGITKFH